MNQKQKLKVPAIEVSIIIISYNVQKYLMQCIKSILHHTNIKFKYEIIVIDNHSYDDTEKEVKQRYPLIIYIQNSENIGFTKAMNQAINKSKGRYIFQLNPDTELVEDSISKLHQYASNNNNLAILGPMITDENGRVQPSHWDAPTLLSAMLNLSNLQSVTNQFRKIKNPMRPIKVDSISGAAMFYQTSTIKRIGTFNESLFWDEDIDFCLRAEKQGYNIVFFPHTHLIHKKGKSAGTNQKVAIANQVLSKINFFKIHHSWISQMIFKIFCIAILPIKILLLLFMAPWKPIFLKKAAAYFFTWRLLIKRDYRIQL